LATSVDAPNSQEFLDKLSKITEMRSKYTALLNFVESIQSTTCHRTAINAVILANLRNKYLSESIDEKQLKLLQLTAQFATVSNHKTDREILNNGDLLFFYMKSLGVSEEDSQKYAQILVNSLVSTYVRYELKIGSSGDIEWVENKNYVQSSESKIIQDCLTLGILDKTIALNSSLQIAEEVKDKKRELIDDIGHLILENRALIANQWDAPLSNKSNQYYVEVMQSEQNKRKGETEVSLQQTQDELNNGQYKLMHFMYNNGHNLDPAQFNEFKYYSSTVGLSTKPTAEDMAYMSYNGLLYARGFYAPHSKTREAFEGIKKFTTPDVTIPKAKDAVLEELYKVGRRKEIDTRKKGALGYGEEKHGNLNRSIIQLNPGALTFSFAGGLIYHKDKLKVKQVYTRDSVTKSGTKAHLSFQGRQDEQSIKSDLDDLTQHAKLRGGTTHSAYTYNNGNQSVRYNEVIADVYDYDCLYFNQDDNHGRMVKAKKDFYPHKNLAIFEVLYIENAYMSMHNGEKLPIWKISSADNSFEEFNYDDLMKEESMVPLWTSAVGDTIPLLLKYNHITLHELNSLDANQLKFLCMDGEIKTDRFPLDDFYPDQLKEEINKQISVKKQELLDKHVLAQLQDTNGLKNKSLYNLLELCFHPSEQDGIKKLQQSCLDNLISSNLTTDKLNDNHLKLPDLLIHLKKNNNPQFNEFLSKNIETIYDHILKRIIENDYITDTNIISSMINLNEEVAKTKYKNSFHFEMLSHLETCPSIPPKLDTLVALYKTSTTAADRDFIKSVMNNTLKDFDVNNKPSISKMNSIIKASIECGIDRNTLKVFFDKLIFPQTKPNHYIYEEKDVAQYMEILDLLKLNTGSPKDEVYVRWLVEGIPNSFSFERVSSFLKSLPEGMHDLHIANFIRLLKAIDPEFNKENPNVSDDLKTIVKNKIKELTCGNSLHEIYESLRVYKTIPFLKTESPLLGNIVSFHETLEKSSLKTDNFEGYYKASRLRDSLISIPNQIKKVEALIQQLEQTNWKRMTGGSLKGKEIKEVMHELSKLLDELKSATPDANKLVEAIAKIESIGLKNQPQNIVNKLVSKVLDNKLKNLFNLCKDIKNFSAPDFVDELTKLSQRVQLTQSSSKTKTSFFQSIGNISREDTDLPKHDPEKDNDFTI
jgi:flagellin-specific chaperone FliS